MQHTNKDASKSPLPLSSSIVELIKYWQASDCINCFEYWLFTNRGVAFCNKVPMAILVLAVHGSKESQCQAMSKNRISKGHSFVLFGVSSAFSSIWYNTVG